MRFTIATLLLLVFGLTGATYAAVNLEWRPSQQAVGVGDTATIGLYMVASGAASEMVGSMDVVVLWDPAYLGAPSLGDPLPWWDSDGYSLVWDINAYYEDPPGTAKLNNDGDCMYTAWAPLGSWNSVEVTPGGVLAVEFQFTALAVTSGTWVTIAPTYGLYTTAVYDGSQGNLDIKGTLGSALVVVPEPSSLLALGVGLLSVIANRKRRS